MVTAARARCECELDFGRAHLYLTSTPLSTSDFESTYPGWRILSPIITS